MENYTPWASFFGGLLIAAASLIVLYQGRICGISGIYGSLFEFKLTGKLWRYCFIIGLLSAGVLFRFFYPEALASEMNRSYPLMFVGGFLVGLGTRIGGGCTSGHGVCGMGRFSLRSIVASLTFLFFGVLSASLIYYVRGA